VNNLSVKLTHLLTHSHSRDMSNVLCGSWHVISRLIRDTNGSSDPLVRPRAPARSFLSHHCVEQVSCRGPVRAPLRRHSRPR
jgi:hypothetical protein